MSTSSLYRWKVFGRCGTVMQQGNKTLHIHLLYVVWYTHRLKAYGMESMVLWTALSLSLSDQEILSELVGSLAKGCYRNTTVDKDSAAAKFSNQCFGSSLCVQEEYPWFRVSFGRCWCWLGFSRASSRALQTAMSVGLSVCLLVGWTVSLSTNLVQIEILWFWMKCLNNYLMDSHEIGFRLTVTSCSPGWIVITLVNPFTFHLVPSNF